MGQEVAGVRADGNDEPRDLAAWNDAMYHKHPTPYGRGIAGAISAARVRTVLRMAEVRPADAVLEIGCESGHLLLQVPPCRLRTGADISHAALEDARDGATRAAAERMRFIQLNAAQPLPFAPGEFDVIIISEMLEHVARPRTVLEQVHAICTPETRLVITVPNERPKLVIKNVLRRLRLFDLLFPGIEEGQSEWHLQVFSKPLIRDTVKGLFAVRALESVWGAHYAALLSRLAPAAA
jgi:SAM-dependent methyltransferase